MSNNIYKPLAGQTFKEGSYEYRIYVKTGDIGDDLIISISIFLENTPDIIGMDLIQLAMKHVSELTPDDMKSSAQFMINKVVMEEYESIGEISRSLMKGVSLGLQALDSLNHVIERNLDKKIDFEEINRIIAARKRKLEKTILFLDVNLKNINANNKTYTIKHITAVINGAPVKNSEGIIKPGISIRITLDVAAKNLHNLSSWEITKEFEEIFKEHSVIDLHSYDKLNVEVKKV